MATKFKPGFTLLELLVVISIIALLASMVFASVNSAREKAGIADAIRKVKDLQKAVAMFYDDTGVYPADCGSDCTAAMDPLINSFGVPGWKGPYARQWDLAHYWKGHIGFRSRVIGGQTQYFILLDDDRPTLGGNDNGGLLPLQAALRIDQMLDDGVFNSGEIRGYGPADDQHFGSAEGELAIRIRL